MSLSLLSPTFSGCPPFFFLSFFLPLLFPPLLFFLGPHFPLHLFSPLICSPRSSSVSSNAPSFLFTLFSFIRSINLYPSLFLSSQLSHFFPASPHHLSQGFFSLSLNRLFFSTMLFLAASYIFRVLIFLNDLSLFSNRLPYFSIPAPFVASSFLQPLLSCFILVFPFLSLELSLFSISLF